MLSSPCRIAVLLSVLIAPAIASAQPLERQWYTPPQLLSALAERDGVRWAMPQTLSGNAFVGGVDAPLATVLDDACQQWALAWTKTGAGIIVVHRAQDDSLRRWSETLKKGGDDARDAAWELGWLRDGRAVPVLAEALANAAQDTPLALAAAQALQTLLTDVPLGRTEQVDAHLPGRASLAAAFPPSVDLAPLLNSPYPPIRAATLRVLLGTGRSSGKAAGQKMADDRSVLVQRVRQQMLFEPAPVPPPADRVQAFGSEGPAEIPAAPADPAELAAACEKMLADIPELAKKSQWEQMRWRARMLAGWSRLGHDAATDALIRMGRLDVQSNWFPPYAHRQLAATGKPAVVERLREVFAAKRDAGRSTIVRGLEPVRWGEGLLEFTRPHLGDQTVCYVTARKAGREALEDLLPLAAQVGKPRTPRDPDRDPEYFALDCLGTIGGSHAVKLLTQKLAEDEPGSSTLAFRSAKALAAAGTADALAALLAAADSPDRIRRHAAVLFLGQIGGPDAEAKLLGILEKSDDRFIRAAAADALEQIGTPPARAAVAQFRQSDAGPPPLVHKPRNPRFGAEFPVNEWTDLKIRILAYAAYGEMGWNYDAANKLFFRYGGCSGYTNELTLFDPGNERFVQRRPNEEMAGWDDRRPPRGCSAGRAWDPHRKVAWIGPSIGGSDADIAIAEYYNKGGRRAGAAGYHLSSYDLATDRFRGVDYRQTVQNEPPKRFAYDWCNGLLYPVVLSPFANEKPFWSLDTRSVDPWTDPQQAWQDRKTVGDYPRMGGYTVAAVDQASGLLVMYVPPSAVTKNQPQTWTYDPRAGEWKNMHPDPQPRAVAGGGFVFDPFHKVMLLQSGQQATQFGGAADTLTWTYDVRTNRWTDLAPANGPGNPWVGAMDFDPEHNVYLLFNLKTRSVWAYRLKAVAHGTQARTE